MFLQEIESFDTLNQQRLEDELSLLQEKLDTLIDDVVNLQTTNTMDNKFNPIHETNYDKGGDSTSQNLLIEQYREHNNNLQSRNSYNVKNTNITNIEIIGYELKFIGDRIFNFTQ